jgi:uncharacterized protein (TIGR02996 family)
MRTFTCTDLKSHKFWNIELRGNTFTVTYGRQGTAGQTQTKAFPDEDRARQEHDKLVQEKLAKGYVETTPGAPQPAPAAPDEAAPAAAPGKAGLRTFAFSDARSHKFWNIELKGRSFTVTYGRRGTAGQTQTKQFPDAAKAEKEYDKLVKEKQARGYFETTPRTAAPATPMRAALEAALAADPDDLASHMAYADYLSEQGDPRGEFIQVQFALEDAAQPAAERKKLQKREQELLGAHAREWLGELAPYLLDRKPKKQRTYQDMVCQYRFARGWLDTLEASRFTVAFARTLARAPQTRLLRRLALSDQAYEERGEYEAGDDVPEGAFYPQLYPLLRSPYLGNVRVLQLGEPMSSEEEEDADDGGISCHTEGEAAIGLVKRMPRLEELYLLAHNVDTDQLFSLRTLPDLRILQVDHNHNYPLARLARNPSLGKLTHLLCHPHALDAATDDEGPYIRLPAVRALVRATTLPGLTHLRLRLSDMGDKGCAEVVGSGILQRLRVLDLNHGCVSDEGARLFAACPDARNLELLSLNRNCLTEAGTGALKAAGVRFAAENQWQPVGDDYEDNQYLYDGDIE